MQQAIASPPGKWGIRLVPGATAGQVAIFLVVITITMLLFGFVSIIQPYLYNEVMHVPLKKQGQITGLLQMVQYAAVAIFIIPVGSLSDSVGRKTVLIAAMIGFIVTLLVLPFCAPVFAALLVRFLLGAASTGHTTGGATMMVDYPSNDTRGRFIALMLVVQSLAGALFTGWFFPHLPAWLIARGFTPTDALRSALWGLAAIGVIGVLIAVLFLKPPPHQQGQAAARKEKVSVLKTTAELWRAARADPALGLVVIIAFVIRSDYFVTGSFLSVWIMHSAQLSGLSPAEGLKIAGGAQMMLTLSFAAAPFLLGWIADRVDRVAFLISSLVFGALAFAATCLVRDVQGAVMLAVVAAIGFGETAQTLGSQAVFGERAPPNLRGSAMGFFVLMGTISVIVVSGISGIIFDKFGPTAPFILLAGLNVAFALLALILVRGRKRRDAQAAAAAVV